MKKLSKKSKKPSIAFQSDIVIDENGEVFISFLGPELLHLAGQVKDHQVIDDEKFWEPPTLDEIYFNESEYQNCKICPRSCGFDRTKMAHPLCGDSKLRVSNFGISFGDENIISGSGGSGVIFLSGCPLTCPSCINKEKVHTQGQEVTPKEFIDLIKCLKEKSVSNIQILSPTVHLPNLRAILKSLKDSKFPIPIALKTSGHDLPDQISKLRGLVDIFIPDLKPCFNFVWSKEARIEENYPKLFEDSINEMFKQLGSPRFSKEGEILSGIVIRYVKPPFLSSDQEAKTMEFLNSYQDRAYVSVLDNYVIQK